MCGSRASAVDVDIGNPALESFVPEYSFSHGGAADIAEADDENRDRHRLLCTSLRWVVTVAGPRSYRCALLS
jgi:hypothetical protein